MITDFIFQSRRKTRAMEQIENTVKTIFYVLNNKFILFVKNFQILAFLMNICHTIIYTIDWFIDLNAVRELIKSELFYLEKDITNKSRRVNLGMQFINNICLCFKY